MLNEVINKRVYDFSKHTDIIQTIIIFLISLLVPTFLGEILKSIFATNSVVVTNSQIIIGSIVNTALIVAALNLKGWNKILGVVTMPSIATIFGGYVFKTASVYMVYMIPAIWVGNFALIYSYKLIMLSKNKHYFLAGIIGIAIKVAIIFGGFSILKLIGIFPDKIVSTLQIAMSTTQAITAIIGTVIAFGIYKLENKQKAE
ncbi:MAG: hypothetical protein HFJ17_06025 [Clostridia bacterium]|nr:hypothetical protein [Clostridia bacterium]